MKRRAVAITALALPAIVVALVALVLLGRGDTTESACPTLDVPLADPAVGPRGWTARGRYEQWEEGGQCLGSLGVSFFAPGESWEDEAWSPAAHVAVRRGLLPPPTRERAFLAWGEDGQPILFGFGDDGAPLVVDRLPDSPGGPLVRRCEVLDGVRTDGEIDWSRVEEADESDGCVLLRVE